MEAGTVERNGLEDLQLSPAEAGEEAAERARLEGLGVEEIDRQRQEAVADAQARLEPDAKAEELRQEAGEAVGKMPPAERQSTVVPPDQILLRGTAKSTPKWAGKQPGVTTIKLTGVKFAVDGGYRKGETIRFTGEALVVSEGVKDTLDKETHTVSESTQEHEARVLDIELLDDGE